MFKHWSLHHDGKETAFKVEVIDYFESALYRQVAEGVRIARTGAEKILNSKAVYSRSGLVRLVCVDTVEEDNLGDRDSMPDEEDDGDGD